MPAQAALEAKIEKARADLAAATAQVEQARQELSTVSPDAARDPEAVTRRHIRLLHDYNEIKDVGQGLLGLIAESRGCRYVEVQEEYLYA
ncbi:hypothetical protein KEM52_001724 [Ascosphaera acerosa]|nr:hypothetical protein KEM52_001724 [Ascosphaera acerosa]